MLDFGFYFIWSIGLWLFLSSLGATLMIFLKTTSDLCNRPSINKRAASSEYLKYKDSFPNSYRTALCTGTVDILIVSSPGVYNTAGQHVEVRQFLVFLCPGSKSCAGTIASSVSSSQSASGEPGVTVPSVTPWRIPPQLQELRSSLVSAGFFSTRLLKQPILQPAPGQFRSKSVFILLEMMPLEPLRDDVQSIVVI